MTFESLRSKIRAVAGLGSSASASELDPRPSSTSLKRTASSVAAMDSTLGDLDPLYSSRKRMRITLDTPPSPPPELNPFNASAVNALESMFGRVIALASSAKTPLSSSSPSYRTPLSKLQEQQRQLQQQRARERQSRLQREQALAQSRAKDHPKIAGSTVPQREFTFSLTNGHPQQTPAIQSAWSQLLGKSTQDGSTKSTVDTSTGYKFMLPPSPGAVPPPTVVKEAPHPQHRTAYNFGGQTEAMRGGPSTFTEPRKAQTPPAAEKVDSDVVELLSSDDEDAAEEQEEFDYDEEFGSDENYSESYSNDNIEEYEDEELEELEAEEGYHNEDEQLDIRVRNSRPDRFPETNAQFSSSNQAAVNLDEEEEENDKEEEYFEDETSFQSGQDEDEEEEEEEEQEESDGQDLEDALRQERNARNRTMHGPLKFPRPSHNQPDIARAPLPSRSHLNAGEEPYSRDIDQYSDEEVDDEDEIEDDEVGSGEEDEEEEGLDQAEEEPQVTYRPRPSMWNHQQASQPHSLTDRLPSAGKPSGGSPSDDVVLLLDSDDEDVDATTQTGNANPTADSDDDQEDFEEAESEDEDEELDQEQYDDEDEQETDFQGKPGFEADETQMASQSHGAYSPIDGEETTEDAEAVDAEQVNLIQAKYSRPDFDSEHGEISPSQELEYESEDRLELQPTRYQFGDGEGHEELPSEDSAEAYDNEDLEEVESDEEAEAIDDEQPDMDHQHDIELIGDDEEAGTVTFELEQEVMEGSQGTENVTDLDGEPSSDTSLAQDISLAFNPVDAVEDEALSGSADASLIQLPQVDAELSVTQTEGFIPDAMELSYSMEANSPLIVEGDLARPASGEGMVFDQQLVDTAVREIIAANNIASLLDSAAESSFLAEEDERPRFGQPVSFMERLQAAAQEDQTEFTPELINALSSTPSQSQVTSDVDLSQSIPRKSRLTRVGTMAQTVLEGKAFLEKTESRRQSQTPTSGNDSESTFEASEPMEEPVIPVTSMDAITQKAMSAPAVAQALSPTVARSSQSGHRGEIELLVKEARAFCGGSFGGARSASSPGSVHGSPAFGAFDTLPPLGNISMSSPLSQFDAGHGSPSRGMGYVRRRTSLGSSSEKASGDDDAAEMNQGPVFSSSSMYSPLTSRKGGVVDLAAERVIQSTVVGNHALRAFINPPSPAGAAIAMGSGSGSGSRSGSLEPSAAMMSPTATHQYQNTAATNLFNFGQPSFGFGGAAGLGAFGGIQESGSSPGSSSRTSPQSVGFVFGSTFLTGNSNSVPVVDSKPPSRPTSVFTAPTAVPDTPPRRTAGLSFGSGDIAESVDNDTSEQQREHEREEVLDPFLEGLEPPTSLHTDTTSAEKEATSEAEPAGAADTEAVLEKKPEQQEEQAQSSDSGAPIALVDDEGEDDGPGGQGDEEEEGVEEMDDGEEDEEGGEGEGADAANSAATTLSGSVKKSKRKRPAFKTPGNNRQKRAALRLSKRTLRS